MKKICFLSFCIDFQLILLYTKSEIKSILKTRYEVRISDMNILMNPNVSFSYAGFFQNSGEWIHPKKTEVTYEIVYVTEGEVYMREGDTDIHAKKGELFLLSPGVCHYGTAFTSGVAFYWVHFYTEASLPFKKRFFGSFESSYLFKELLHYNNLPHVPEYLVNSVLVHILSEMCRADGETAEGYSGLAEKIYEWIRINASAGLTVKRISEHFGYSADHISRICKKYFGAGARELTDRFLLAAAKSSLSNTDKYVKEIAAELGFSDDKAFIGFFKYHEGCFPSEFRNRFGRLHMNRK